MGPARKEPCEKKNEGPQSPEVAKPQRVSGTVSKTNEIDEIFGKKNRNRATQNQDTHAIDDAMGSRSSSQKNNKVKRKKRSVDENGKVNAGNELEGDGNGWKSSSSSAAELGLSKPRKKTADGLTIYGEDELKWNNKDAGGTPNCPFDCDCCF